MCAFLVGRAWRAGQEVTKQADDGSDQVGHGGSRWSVWSLFSFCLEGFLSGDIYFYLLSWPCPQSTCLTRFTQASEEPHCVSAPADSDAGSLWITLWQTLLQFLCLFWDFLSGSQASALPLSCRHFPKIYHHLKTTEHILGSSHVAQAA